MKYSAIYQTKIAIRDYVPSVNYKHVLREHF